VEKLPENPLVHYHLGMAYFKLDKKEQAKKELKRALKLKPVFLGSEVAKQTLEELKQE